MSKDEKLMILQMVSDGKITPEEGAELLRALGGATQTKAEPVVRKPDGVVVRTTVEQSVERAIRAAEKAAREATKHVEGLTEGLTEGLAETVAKEAAREGARIGQVTGEAAGNLGRLISRMFAGGYSGAPRFELKEEVKGEFTGEGEVQVSLSTGNGHIAVDTWDETGYRLVVVKKVNAPNEGEAREISKDVYDFFQEGLVLKATARDGQRWLRQLSVHFQLTLPRDRKAALLVDTSNGRVNVSGVSGSRMRADSANGRIEVERGDFDSADLDTANGRIEYRGRASDLRADTANGRIEVDLEGAGTWNLDTANGRIEAKIRREPGVAYSVDLSTVMGKMDVSGMEDAKVLVDDSKQKFAKRYKAETRDFAEAPAKGLLKASTAMGRVTVSL